MGTMEVKMNIKTMTDNIYILSMGIKRMLFESIWDTPHGVTLNSYIVKGEKTAIIDGFIGWDGVPETLYQSLADINIDPKNINYLILNHLEPDHSGWIKDFMKINQDFEILTTKKGADLVRAFYGDDLNVRIVEDGDQLDLGKGMNLTFYPTPNVHWPETMLTYESNSKTLFSCDLYGAFGYIDGKLFDDELSDEEDALFEEEGLRYFSNVMTTFSSMAERAIKKTEALDIKVVAPGHGIVYRKHPGQIIDAYKRYCQYAKGLGKNEVALLWGSMYGMTQIAVDNIVEWLKNEGVKVNVLQLPQASKSEIVMTVFKSAALILAAPTYEYKLFPPMAHAIDEIGRKRIVGKPVLRFGSYGWSGGAEKELKELVENHRLKWKFLESIEFKGMPNEDDLSAIRKSVQALVDQMKANLL